jgi:beta-lactamase class A
MFQLFKMRDEGQLDLSATIPVTNRFASIVDGSEFSLPMSSEEDEILYPFVGQQLSYLELIDKMITYSSNLATNILVQVAKPESISVTLNAIPAPGVLVLRGVEDLKAYEMGLSNMTSAFGMMKMMEAVYRSEMVADSSRERMIAILKDQQYNSMIPAGLPDDVVVAHKTGSITRIAHDAAIVYPPDTAPFVLVILTRGWDSGKEARAVGARLTEHVYQIHRGEITTTEIPIPEIIARN